MRFFQTVFLQKILNHYEENFHKYGLINVDDIKNLHFIFNAYPKIRSLYFKHHINNAKLMKSPPSYKSIDKDILEELLVESIFSQQTSNSIITDQYGRQYVVAKDKGNNFYLGIILFENNDKCRVHFSGYISYYDEDVEKINVHTIKHDGYYSPRLKCLITDITRPFVYVLQQIKMKNEFSRKNMTVIEDLNNFPDFIKMLPLFKEVWNKFGGR